MWRRKIREAGESSTDGIAMEFLGKGNYCNYSVKTSVINILEFGKLQIKLMKNVCFYFHSLRFNLIYIFC